VLMTVQEFRARIDAEIDAVVRELQEQTGRYGDEEAAAWRQSLPKLATLLSSEAIQPLHLYVQGRGQLAVEYQLPASGSFADAVLLGAHEAHPSAVVIELKDWITRADRPGRAEGLIERRGAQDLHPSDQVRGYVEYCRRFHSAVQDHSASVHGCVLFTRDYVVAPYLEQPNARLAADFPLFTLSREDVIDRVPEFFRSRLTAPDAGFAQAFATGRYRQVRGFIQQIARQVISANSRPFELLDNQRRALALCKAVASEVVQGWLNGRTHRKVVVVVGPPGSGKSAVAARLWAEVSLMPKVPEGDIVFVTTSMSQNSNWADIFEGIGAEGARGVVRKATAFYPATTHRVGQLRKRHGKNFLEGVFAWRNHLESLRNVRESCRDGANDLNHLVAIVDEAHSLINPEREGGTGQFGFAPTLGPQAYHIIRCSTLSIFFLDPQQGFRQRENTTLEDIRGWARELGAGDVTLVRLEGVQFRCAGSTEYVAWVEGLLDGASAGRNAVLATAWRFSTSHVDRQVAVSGAGRPPSVRDASPDYREHDNLVVLRTRTRHQPFDFRICTDPFELESNLRESMRDGATARLLSTYSRQWKTRGMTHPHGLPPSKSDFCEEWLVDGHAQTWSRVWNFVPNNSDDYTQWVQAKPGSVMADDPLAEVGCPYAVRGFDYDYVGLLWLEDLVWRDGNWKLHLEHLWESGLSGLVRRARRQHGTGPAYDELLRKVTRAYRILLTRALKGLFVWIKDEETAAHVGRSLGDR
jgi:uncharacterized protein